MQLRETPTGTPALPVCAVSLYITLLPAILLVYVLFLHPTAAHRGPVEALRKPWPMVEPVTWLHIEAHGDPRSPPITFPGVFATEHCRSRNLECKVLCSPPGWILFHYLILIPIFSQTHGSTSTRLKASHRTWELITQSSCTALHK